MLDMVLNVIREQSVFVLMGLLVVGGLFAQLMASRRYRKLRSGIQSLAALQNPSSSASSLRTQSIQLARSERAERRRQAQLEREQEAGLADGASKPDQSSAEALAGASTEKESSATDKRRSAVDEVMPAGDKRRTAVDEVTPAGDKRRSAVDKVTPAGDRRRSAADEVTPAGDKARSVADKLPGVDKPGSPADKPMAEGAEADEVDSQLLYLRQSLDRIAAGRDQKLEEEPRRRRKLTPAEEQVIVDILREYLS